MGSRSDADNSGAIMIGIGLAGLTVVVSFANAIGADVPPTALALWWTIVCAVPVVGYYVAIGRDRYNPPMIGLYFLFWGTLAWWAWWPVLDSIAANHGQARALAEQIFHPRPQRADLMPYEEITSWYASMWFKWLGQLVLVVATVLSIKHWRNLD